MTSQLTSADRRGDLSGRSHGSESVFLFVHSPLVGPESWTPVAELLSQQGFDVALGRLQDRVYSAQPWWRQHVESVTRPLGRASLPFVLVGHSGAGPLLPLIGQRLRVPPRGYLFVDAGILWQPASRLEMMAAEDVAWAREFEAHLRGGGRFPDWSDEQLAAILPDQEMRVRLLRSVCPRGLDFFCEPIPVPANWDRVPCAYLQLSETYRTYANEAGARGWHVERLDSHHFATLTDPEAVVKGLLRLLA